jgi:hypothetical protein
VIWQATFERLDGTAIRETVFPADDLHDAILYIANGEVEIPEGTMAMRLALQAVESR